MKTTKDVKSAQNDIMVYKKPSNTLFFNCDQKIRKLLTLLHSIKQIWSKLDNKKWSKLYKMWVTLLQSRSYRVFKVYFK